MSDTITDKIDDVLQYAPRGFLFTTARATFDKVLLVSAALGGILFTGLTLAALSPVMYPQFWLFFSILGFFHLAEFYVTAVYNLSKLRMTSFLLTNGTGYLYAQLLAVTEAVIVHIFRPQWHTSVWTWVGLALVVVGQYIRIQAMVTAASSFSHLLAVEKRRDHALIKHGIYSWFRHPSYTGYLVWAVGSQIFIMNPLSTIVFAAVLWVFFAGRIPREEQYLTEFFGKEYTEYKKETWSGIPFLA